MKFHKVISSINGISSNPSTNKLDNSNSETTNNVCTNIEYYTVPEFSKHGFQNIFTTKRNGHSFSTNELNFGTNCGDNPEDILINYIDTLKILGSEPQKAVKTKQTHSDITINVDKSFGGEGILREQRFIEADGLMTTERDLTLIIFFADCVPIILADKRTKTISAVHSGWRGTKDDITGKAIDKMISEHSSDPKDILCAIGPSIGVCHFEVSEDVYNELTSLYGNDCGNIKDSKFYLDLKQAVYNQAISRGVLPQNIVKSDICTYCDNDLYSFRREGDKAGRMAAMLQVQSS